MTALLFHISSKTGCYLSTKCFYNELFKLRVTSDQSANLMDALCRNGSQPPEELALCSHIVCAPQSGQEHWPGDGASWHASTANGHRRSGFLCGVMSIMNASECMRAAPRRTEPMGDMQASAAHRLPNWCGRHVHDTVQRVAVAPFP